MLHLGRRRVLQDNIQIKEDVLVCTSLMFVTVCSHSWITKRKNLGYIRQYTDDKACAGISIYQLKQYHPGLVPQLLVKLTWEIIWATQVMVDQFSGLVYVNIIRRKSQEKTLEGKVSFDWWSATFGIQIKRYHVENWSFYEKPFMEAFQDPK